MERLNIASKLTGAAVAIALCASPTLAAAAAVPAQPLSPLVALSAFGSQASAQAVCGSAAATAAGAAAVQGQPGCVLPAVDAPPPPPVGETPPIQPAAAPGGFSISPVLLGLVGIAALAALIAAGGDDSDADPESPD